MKAVLIPVHGAPEEIEVATWEDIHDACDGYFQVAPTPGSPFTMYVNEEGKLNGLEFNRTADTLANVYRSWSDPVVGPALLMGLPTADGEDTEFTLAEYERVKV